MTTPDTPDTARSAAEPEIVDLEAATTAVVRGVVPVAELAGFFDRSFSELAAVLGRQGVTVAGPAFGLYRAFDGGTADLEVGFPTDGVVQPDGDVVAGALPGGRVARLVHHGSFDQLGASWERLRTWIVERRGTPGPEFWEVYVTEPSPEMDPADLITQLNWPFTG